MMMEQEQRKLSIKNTQTSSFHGELKLNTFGSKLKGRAFIGVSFFFSCFFIGRQER
jgi:hypothetical protein